VLVRHFLKQLAPEDEIAVSDEAMAALARAPWRGNVRELINLCERLVTLRHADHIELRDLPVRLLAARDPAQRAVNLPPDGIALDQLIRDVLVQALERCGWNQTRAARFLRVPRHILIYRMGKYGIVPPKA
jgi:two-component system NtrC family response regulator